MVIPCLCSFRFSSCTVHHKTAVIPVDIPRRWEPRTNQSPTGALIAFAALGTCCSSPVPPTKTTRLIRVGSFCFAGALRDGVVYSAWFNNSEVVEETNMEDNKSMNVKKTVKSGITFGSALAMVISYTTWKSVGWAIFHGLLSWVYVIYFLLRY